MKVMTMNIDEVAVEIHKNNIEAGWWPEGRSIPEVYQLISTEISEATEGERKDLMDDHLTERKMGEVELADALIRLLDLAGFKGWEFSKTDVSPLFNEEAPIAEKHWLLSQWLVALYSSEMLEDPEGDTPEGVLVPSNAYSILLCLICATAESCGYHVWEALEEKLEYNKNRPDHKKEVREGKNGKAF